MNNHLTQEQLIGYIHHTLTDAEREELDQHLASCAQCRALLTEHETTQRRIRYDLAGGLKKVQPSNKMSFSAISTNLKRRRGWPFLLTALDRPLSSVVAAGMLAVLVFALFAIFGYPAPGSPQIVSKPTPEPVIIVFAHHPYDTEYYAGLIEEFNQLYPYITIQQYTRPYKTVEGELRADAPDVILDWQYSLAALQTGGRLLDLMPYYKQDSPSPDQKSELYQSTLNLFQYEGRLWAIPISVEPMVMYYNKDLFDRHGLAYPKTGWTWQDFETIANTINEPLDGIAGYVPIKKEEGYLDLFIFIHQNGGKVFEGTPMAVRPSFTDSLTLEAVEWYANLMPRYYVGSVNRAQINFTGYGPSYFWGVLSRKAGMWMGPPSLEFEYAPDNWYDMRWGVVPLPRQAQPATAAWVDGLAITANTKNPEAAWQWVKFLSQQLPYQKAPVYESLLKSDAYEHMVGSEMAAVTREELHYTDLLSHKVAENEHAFGEIFVDAIYNIMHKKIIPHDALQQAQQKAEAILEADHQ
jgi:multiple sugar transport system substrate-binding protein